MADVVGVDATRGAAWVAVTLRDGRLLSMALHPSLAGVVADHPGANAFAVDIPIGHEDPSGSVDGGRRACDAAARAYLGPQRAASVFWVPPPGVLECRDQTDAATLTRSRGWIAPSAQLWALRARILEARESATDPRVFEVHPEVSFQAAREASKRGEGPLAHPKSSWGGLVERLEILHALRLRPERSMGGVGRAGPDDVLDATIAAWSAGRLADGTAQCLPPRPKQDPATGRAVAIWY